MLTAIVVFLAAFTVVLLIASIIPSAASKEVKVTLERLDAIAQSAKTVQDEALDVRRNQLASALPWLDRLLHGLEFTSRVRLLLHQADVNWTVGRVVATCLWSAIIPGYLVQLRTGAVGLALFVAALGGALPLVYLLRKRASRFAQFEQLLPEAVDLMVAAIRAGHGFTSAMGLVAKECPEPVRREFRQCWDEQNFGLELRAAMGNLVYRVPISDLRMIVTAVMIQQESGGNLTEILEKVAHLIRERFRLKRQVSVHTAQGRATAWVLCGLPFVLGFVLYILNPTHMRLLWNHPTGIKLTYLGLGMMTLGVLTIRKIIRLRV
jgi:tight adherence protein B